MSDRSSMKETYTELGGSSVIQRLSDGRSVREAYAAIAIHESAATAIHESGHAVVHHILGNRVTYVTIVPNNRKGSAGDVKVVHREPTPKEISTGDFQAHESYIVGCFAGYWAAKLFSDYPVIARLHCRTDFQEVDRTLRYITTDPSKRRKLRATLKERSKTIVLQNERAIRRVAQVLLKEKHFGNSRCLDCNREAADRLDEILNERPRGSRSCTGQCVTRWKPEKTRRRNFNLRRRKSR